MEYLIVSGETLEALVYIVNQRRAEGWRPQGGPFLAPVEMWAERPKKNKSRWLAAQAMVKVRPNEPECKDGIP